MVRQLEPAAGRQAQEQAAGRGLHRGGGDLLQEAQDGARQGHVHGLQPRRVQGAPGPGVRGAPPAAGLPAGDNNNDDDNHDSDNDDDDDAGLPSALQHRHPGRGRRHGGPREDGRDWRRVSSC